MEKEIREQNDLILTSLGGQVIRTPLKSISVLGRNAQGVRIIKLGQGDGVSSGDVVVEQ
jgi:DNA gyrase subunit A